MTIDPKRKKDKKWPTNEPTKGTSLVISTIYFNRIIMYGDFLDSFDREGQNNRTIRTPQGENTFSAKVTFFPDPDLWGSLTNIALQLNFSEL